MSRTSARTGPRTAFLLAGILLLVVSGCPRPTPSGAPIKVLRLATTTSTRDSGLLEQLLPPFERQHDCRVDVIAVGTGAALKLGERGDADVVMVHARVAEEAFMAAGHGNRHEEFMVNEFMLLGPKTDPAQVRELPIHVALAKVASHQQAFFLSRGDESGTHKREQELWNAAGGRPSWEGYWETGQGMGPTLMMADEKQAYVLADRATYLKFHPRIDLVPLNPPSDSLRNPYSAIVVDHDQLPNTNIDLANGFVDYLISEAAQQLIADYRISNRALFEPTRLTDSE